MRKTLIALTTAAILAVPSTAFAATDPGNQQPPTPRPRLAPAPHFSIPDVQPPLCVTTQWRSKHTHKPITRPGTVCILTRDMWKPKSWRVLLTWIRVDNVGPEVEFVLARPTRTHR
jgi:hypothetical protein